MQAITLYPVITEKFFKAHKRLEEGKCKITDVIIGYQGDAEDFAEKILCVVNFIFTLG
jgi:RNA polymerase primary sigma factor